MSSPLDNSLLRLVIQNQLSGRGRRDDPRAVAQHRMQQEEAFAAELAKQGVAVAKLKGLFSAARPAFFDVLEEQQKIRKKQEKAQEVAGQPDNLNRQEVVGGLRRAENVAGGAGQTPGFAELSDAILGQRSARKAEAQEAVRGTAITGASGAIAEAGGLSESIRNVLAEAVGPAAAGPAAAAAGLGAADLTASERRAIRSENRAEARALRTDLRAEGRAEEARRLEQEDKLREEQELREEYGSAFNFSPRKAKALEDNKAVQELYAGGIVRKRGEQTMTRADRSAGLLSQLARIEALSNRIAELNLGGAGSIQINDAGEVIGFESLTDPELARLSAELGGFVLDFVTMLSGAAFREDEESKARKFLPAGGTLKIDVNGKGLSRPAKARLDAARSFLFDRFIPLYSTEEERREARSRSEERYRRELAEARGRAGAAPAAPQSGRAAAAVDELLRSGLITP